MTAITLAIVASAACRRTSFRDADGRADGARVFAACCAGCHGADGAKRIADGVAPLRVGHGDVRGAVVHGRGAVMPAWDRVLAPDEIDAVISYVERLRRDAR